MSTKKSTAKRAGTQAVQQRSKAKGKAAERHLEAARKLADLTTVKHPKREHTANFELFDARQALVDNLKRFPGPAAKGGWTREEAGHVLLIKKMVESGKFSDFPGYSQQKATELLYAAQELAHRVAETSEA